RVAAPLALYPLSLHDALPICRSSKPRVGSGELRKYQNRRPPPHSHHTARCGFFPAGNRFFPVNPGIFSADFHTIISGNSPPLARSEEHTSELQSRFDLVCRLL